MTPALRLPTIEHLKVRDLIPWGQNPREHSEDQIDRLKLSLEQFGLARLPVIQKGTRRILAGHGLAIALAARGDRDMVIPCVVVDLGQEDADAYTVADNRITDLSEWNLPQLREVIAELDNGAFPIETTGFTEDELRRLFGAPLLGSDDPEEPGEPEPVYVTIALHKDRAEVLRDDEKGLNHKQKKIQAAVNAALFEKGKA